MPVSVCDLFQAHAKQQENLYLESEKQRLQQEIQEGQVAAAAWQQHQILLQQQYQQQQQLQQQPPQPQQPQPQPQQPPQPQPQLQQVDWKSIPVADDTLPKPWEAREDR